MKIIRYKKTPEGVVLVPEREKTQELAPAILRYEAFFQDVPLHGGAEWETLSAEQIAAVFKEAVAEIKKVHQRWHDAAVEEYGRRNRFMRWWRRQGGWKPPIVPLESEIIKDMAERCKDLADWMEQNKHRPFYMGSDMNYLIDKPRAVAGRLVQK